MKKVFFLHVLLWLAATSSPAQQDTNFISAVPIGGFASITNFYQKNLQLTKAEEKLLDNEVLYFEYLVDEEGRATFYSLSGISDKKLTAKIESASVNLPRFQPATSNGQTIESTYSFILKYQEMQYVESAPYRDSYTFKLPNLDEFEEVIPADKRMDVYFGIPMNNYIGKVGNYTGLGGGLTVGGLFGRSKLQVGFDMSVYFNNKNTPFEVNSSLPQLDGMPNIFMGVVAATDLLATPKGRLNLQGHLSYVQMNVSEKIDNEWDKFSGFSPGIRLNYIHRLGKPKARWYYGAPSLTTNALQLHVGIAPTFMSDRQGNGLNMDIGLSYRMLVQQIESIRRKERKETFRL